MRYLNKIVFINSADKSLKYSEVDLDGNVHFIGTQGVGKSTLLRAVLFFYNADTQKLGIPREKKNYNEYYFPYQNSYIIYEVQTEAGKFCLLSFKSQGRVAFRFINAGYDKKFFIDSAGKAFETWDKIREALAKVDSTRIISSYEEYRNILYGNNKGLSNEFRKYALIESKQYQNIPRTIANVFLNAKLDAEFVKETIIKSLNEDEVKIDLSTYSQTHLRDFETNLNDIKKWTDGKIDRQAEKVATTYSALKFLEHKKKELAFQLGYALKKVKGNLPKAQELLNAEELKRDRVNEKLKDLDGVFDKKKGDIQKQIGEIIRQIGRETNSLIEKEGEISKIITEINNDFIARNFVGAIKSMELKTIESKNRIFTLLVEIKNFNDENIFDLGKPDLFSTPGQTNKNEKAISLLIQLIKEMTASKEKEITLSDSFELLFKIVENNNDTGWVEKLTNVGSEGTDVLVKAMINIMLLNVFKEKASKKQKDDFRLHCMMDEIGKLHPNNVKGILKFANDRNILLINSSPTSLNAMDYRYTYLLSKDIKNVTSIKRLVRKITKLEM